MSILNIIKIFNNISEISPIDKFAKSRGISNDLELSKILQRSLSYLYLYRTKRLKNIGKKTCSLWSKIMGISEKEIINWLKK